MPELSEAHPYYVTLALWLAKTGILVLVSGFLAWLGVRVLDTATPLHERERIGESLASAGGVQGAALRPPRERLQPTRPLTEGLQPTGPVEERLWPSGRIREGPQPPGQIGKGLQPPG